MPNKLTDTEIKKALECCDGSFDKCGECPLDNVIQDKLRCWELEKSALDLINRQEEEKTELLGKIEELEANMVELLENIEQLESVITQIKAEAYKECIEKVKDTALEIKENAFQGCYVISKAKLDNLLNELVGDNNV